MTWITDGEAGSSVRAKLNNLMIPISSAAISSPVEYIDIALPSGYAQFRLLLSGVALPGGRDWLAGVISLDGGDTFLCDPVNGDTYGCAEFTQTFTPSSSFSTLQSGRLNSTLLFSVDNSDFYDGEITLVPGDANLAFRATSSLMGFCTSGIWYISRNSVVVNDLATNPPPSPNRANLLRILPLGNGDCAPPTSGETITGRFTLFGIPTT